MQIHENKVIHYAKIFLFLLFCIFTGLLFFELPRISIPLGIAIVLELIGRPLIPKIQKIGISRNIAIFLCTLIIIFFMIFPIIKAFPLIKEEINNLQYYLPKGEKLIRSYYYRIQNELKQFGDFEISDEYLKQLLGLGQTISKWFIFNIPNLLGNLLEWILLIPLFYFFISKDRHIFKSFVLRLVPNSLFEKTYYLLHQFHKKLGDYIFAKAVEASIIGIITTTGLIILNIRLPFLLGPIAAITNIVPYLGPLLGAIPALIVAIIDHGVGTSFYAVLFLYLFANVVDMAFVFPILVSKIVDIHPLVVVISVILGHQYAGMTGMVISIPIASIIKLLINEIFKEYQAENSSKLSS